MIAAAIILLPYQSWAADAITIPDDLIPQIDLGSLIPEAPAKVILKTIGLMTRHRPYEAATPLGRSGFDLGIEATLVKPPSDFISSLTSFANAGSDSSSSTALPALPSVKLHLHKGINDSLDVGISGLYFPGVTFFGGDIKVVVFKPEEGPTWAIRGGYSTTTIDMSRFGKYGSIPLAVQGVDLGTASVVIASKTFTAEVIASRKIDFADPYIGMGYEFTQGQLQIPVKLRVLDTTQTLTSPTYRSNGGGAFMGVDFRMFPIPARIALEGGYSFIGMHYLGLTAGLGI